jgi:transposase
MSGQQALETEVLAKATRRRFTSEYKRKILREVEAFTERGEVGALLRREGLYSSHLAAWRTELERRELAALSPKKRGPKGTQLDERDRRLAEQDREIARLRTRLEHAELIIDVQKKVSVILGVTLPSVERSDGKA